MSEEVTAENRRIFDRVASRIVCEIVVDGRAERAFVLDLSARGLFVQTQSTPEPGSLVEVRLSLDEGAPVALDAVVARQRKVHPGAIAAGEIRGLGLELKMAPEAYFTLIRSLTT